VRRGAHVTVPSETVARHRNEKAKKEKDGEGKGNGFLFDKIARLPRAPNSQARRDLDSVYLFLERKDVCSMDTQYISSSVPSLSLSASIPRFLPRVEVPCVKRTPVDAKRCFTILSGWRTKKKAKKKEEEKLAIKRAAKKCREGREGYVTFDRTRKHNKNSEGCSWKRGGTRILFFIRPDVFSVSLPRTGQDESACTTRKSIPLFKESPTV